MEIALPTVLFAWVCKLHLSPFSISREMGITPQKENAHVHADGARRGQVSAAQTVFFMIFGRTDLRMGVSGAKFDAEVDFEVHFTPAP